MATYAGDIVLQRQPYPPGADRIPINMEFSSGRSTTAEPCKEVPELDFDLDVLNCVQGLFLDANEVDELDGLLHEMEVDDALEDCMSLFSDVNSRGCWCRPDSTTCWCFYDSVYESDCFSCICSNPYECDCYEDWYANNLLYETDFHTVTSSSDFDDANIPYRAEASWDFKTSIKNKYDKYKKDFGERLAFDGGLDLSKSYLKMIRDYLIKIESCLKDLFSLLKVSYIKFDFMFDMCYLTYNLAYHRNKVDLCMTIVQMIKLFFKDKYDEFKDVIFSLSQKFVDSVSSSFTRQSMDWENFSSKRVYELVIDSSIAHCLRSFLFQIIGLRFFKKDTAQMFIKIVGKPKDKQTSYLDFMGSTFELLDKFVSVGYKVSQGSSLKHALLDEDSFVKFIEKTEDCINNSKFYYSGLKENFINDDVFEGRCTIKELTLQIRECVKEGSKLERHPKAPMAFKARLTQLRKIYADIELEVRSRLRKSPFAVVVHGPPQIGKSSILSHVYKTWCDKNEKTFDLSLVYNRNVKEKFWSGHDPLTQPIIHMPELGSVKKEIAEKQGDDSLNELLVLIDNSPYCAEKAEAEEKGKCWVMPELVVVDTNVPEMNISATQNAPSAIKRRFLYVECFLKPEYKSVVGNSLDSQKVAEINPKDKMDLWNFKIYREVPDTSEASLKKLLHPEEVTDIFGLTKILREQMDQRSKEHSQFMEAVNEDFSKYVRESNVMNNIRNHHLLSQFRLFYASCYMRIFRFQLYCYYVCAITWLTINRNKSRKYQFVYGIWNRSWDLTIFMVILCMLRTFYWLHNMIYPKETKVEKAIISRLDMIDEKISQVDEIVTNNNDIVAETCKDVHLNKKRLIKNMPDTVNKCRETCTHPCCIEESGYGDFDLAHDIKRNKDYAERQRLKDVVRRLEELGNKIEKDKDISIKPEGNIVQTNFEWSQEKVDKFVNDLESDTFSSFPKPKKKNDSCKDYDQVENFFPELAPCAERSNKIDEINNRINRNIRSMILYRVDDEGVQSQAKGFALGLKEDFFLINKHYIKRGYDHFIALSTTDKSSGVIKFKFSERASQQIAPDILMIRKPGLLFKDITNFFCDVAFQSSQAFEVSFKGEITSSIFASKLKIVGDENDIPEFTISERFVSDSKSGYGHCGLPLLARVSNQWLLVGLHCAGNSEKKIAIAARVSKEEINFGFREINKHLDLFNVNSQGMFRLPKGKTIDQVTSKSPLLYEQVPGLLVAGSIKDYSIVTPKSKLQETPFFDEIEDCIGVSPYTDGGEKKYLPPLMRSKRVNGKFISPYNIWTRKVGVSKSWIEPEDCQVVSDFLSTYFIDELSKKGIDKIQPLRLDVAVNGYPENFYMRSMKFSTSAGLLMPGGKNKYVEDFSFPWKEDGKKILYDVKEQVCEVVHSYDQSMLSHALIGCQLKDEPRALSKVKSGKTRVFAMSSFEATCVNRMFLMPFYSLMVEYRDLFCTKVGVNMESYEATKMYHDLKNFSPKFLEGDYGGYDTSMPFEVGLISSSIVFNVLKAKGYNERSLRIVRGILSDNMYPTCVMEGNIFIAPGFQPSGKYATAEDNSLRGLTLLVLGFYHLCVKPGHFPLSSFFRLVKPYTYGDDLLCSIKDNVLPYFNNITYGDFVKKELGMTFTDAEKNEHKSPYTDIAHISFLKRRFRFHQPLGRIVACLEKDSICKSMSYVLPSSSINPEEQYLQICDAVLRNLFFHYDSKKEFNVVRNKLIKIICKHTYFKEDFVDHRYPTWKQLLELHR